MPISSLIRSSLRTVSFPCSLSRFSYATSMRNQGRQNQSIEDPAVNWLLRKLQMGQDGCLMGVPWSASYRRQLAIRAVQLYQESSGANSSARGWEYLLVHRDTTADGDLKQRRELISSQSTNQKYHGGARLHWVDQAAVRAALTGRVLILDGVHRAERNVLPVLNNLLENREVNLEDGRQLISAERFDALLATGYSIEQLHEWRLYRVHPDFRVIALGVPIPPFENGHPMDPPFRSRFQVRHVIPPLNVLVREDPSSVASLDPNTKKLMRLAKLMASLRLNHVGASSLSSSALLSSSVPGTSVAALPPPIPESALESTGKLLDRFPGESVSVLLGRLYPFPGVDQRVQSLLADFQLTDPAKSTYMLDKIQTSSDATGAEFKKVIIFSGRERADMTVHHAIRGGPAPISLVQDTILKSINDKYFVTERDLNIVSSAMQSICVGADVCLVGERGSGTTTIAQHLARIMGYSQDSSSDGVNFKNYMETVFCHRDHPHLLQQRTTSEAGDTVYSPTPLLRAALDGKLCHLENIDQLTYDSMVTIYGLVRERECWLPDGSVLVDRNRVRQLESMLGGEVGSLARRKIIGIKDGFRVLATARLDVGQDKGRPNWCTGEIVDMFHYIKVPSYSISDKLCIMEHIGGSVNASRYQQLLRFSENLRSSQADAEPLSLKQLLRICRHLAQHPHESLPDLLDRALLTRFMPVHARSAVRKLMIDSGIKRESKHAGAVVIQEPEFSADGDLYNPLQIDTISAPVYHAKAMEKSLIPNVSFVMNAQHARTLRDLLVDFNMGSHLLLIGNQGVGKNKLCDKFLQYLNRPRDYIQLHRDTTVHSLVLQPSVEDGKIHFKDTPLIQAAKAGRVLVIDEADKAPVHVVYVLKCLAESGQFSLMDGRKLCKSEDSSDERDIIMHPDFRMILLANRPGYPFMGNDFFRALSDTFGCHVIENPDPQSELSVLKAIAPKVSLGTLAKLVHLFGDLRKAFNEGAVDYPYSLRECINVSKHIDRYSEDSLEEALNDVFHFDIYRPHVLELVNGLLKKHDIRVRLVDVTAAYESKEAMPMFVRKQQLQINREIEPPKANDPKHGREDPNNAPHVGGNQWAGGTGGSDTAGLGGRGGPYRLDAGHAVHQISDELKNQVSEEVKRKAKAMAEEGLRKRLQEIHLSAHDAQLYEGHYQNVRNEISALKEILSSVPAKEKEREWIRNLSEGDLDETKLVDMITGQSNVFKKQGTDPSVASNHWQTRTPKRLKFVFDVSASMYRFNGYDGRLNRSLDVAVMIMESLQGLGQKYVYDIVGHSGDSPVHELVTVNKPPTDERQRLHVLQKMVAYTQFCSSGDNTLNAIYRAVETVTSVAADDYFVVVLSDANLRRYQIQPEDIAQALNKDRRVHTSLILIGSLGKEAEILRQKLPGRAHLCMDTKSLPAIMKGIFRTVHE